MFDVVGAKEKEGFADLELSGLIKNFAQFGSNFPYVTLSAFKDGVSFNLSEEEKATFLSGEMERIKELPCSFRVTNVQLIDPVVRAFTENCYQKHGLLTTTNLYITPNSDSQCFVYHGDPHDTLIYQLTGAKEWSFPKQQRELAFLKPALRADAAAFNEKKISFEEELVTIRQGEVMSFPLHLIHKACNKDLEISSHLTISASYPHAYDLKNYLFSRLLKIKGASLSFHQEVTLSDLSSLLQEKNFPVKEWITDYYKNFALKNQALLREGKEY